MLPNMTLTAKGPIQPPPRLAPRLESVAQAIMMWPQVIAATHWNLYANHEVDGADFYVGELELGHIHLDGEVHIPVATPLRKALIKAGLARPFRWGDGWVEVSIKTMADAEHARWLFQLNYDRLAGVTMQQLLDRVSQLPTPALHEKIAR